MINDRKFSCFAKKAIQYLTNNNAIEVSWAAVFNSFSCVTNRSVRVRGELIYSAITPICKYLGYWHHAIGQRAFQGWHSQIKMSMSCVDPIYWSRVWTFARHSTSSKKTVSKVWIIRVINIGRCVLDDADWWFHVELSRLESKIIYYYIIGKESPPELSPTNISVRLTH